MACRDCKWWDLMTLESRVGRVVAECTMDYTTYLAGIPVSVEVSATKSLMAPYEGEGCPQFKERENGVS